MPSVTIDLEDFDEDDILEHVIVIVTDPRSRFGKTIIDAAVALIEKNPTLFQPLPTHDRLTAENPAFTKLMRIRADLQPIAHTLPKSLNDFFYELTGVDIK